MKTNAEKFTCMSGIGIGFRVVAKWVTDLEILEISINLQT